MLVEEKIFEISYNHWPNSSPIQKSVHYISKRKTKLVQGLLRIIRKWCISGYGYITKKLSTVTHLSLISICNIFSGTPCVYTIQYNITYIQDRNKSRQII